MQVCRQKNVGFISVYTSIQWKHLHPSEWFWVGNKIIWNQTVGKSQKQYITSNQVRDHSLLTSTLRIGKSWKVLSYKFNYGLIDLSCMLVYSCFLTTGSLRKSFCNIVKNLSFLFFIFFSCFEHLTGLLLP